MSNEHVNTIVLLILDTICPPVERDMRPIAAAIAPLATMGDPVKPPLPVTVEVSDDENTVTVTTRLEFVNVYGCSKCHAFGTRICGDLPCGIGIRRADGKQGYFREVRG